MPKAKQFLKDSKKKSKHTPSAPSTADEYLVAGVDLEEAGEKWRGGDAVKSARFFVKAIDLYAEGLGRFPQSFDLAYNKARLQYQLTQHPKILAQLPGTLVELLRAALESSRVALKLKHDDDEVLFQTAQCLTSLVEAVSTEINPAEKFKHLEEAIELFQRCLTLQENIYEESQAQMQGHTDAEDQSSTNATESSSGEMDAEMEAAEDQNKGVSMQEDIWATVIEPVTVDSLIDTLISLLETLIVFSNLIIITSQPPSPKSIPWLDKISSTLLNTKLPAYLSAFSDPIPTERRTEVFLARANFLAAFADATFRDGSIDNSTYYRTIDEAFSYDILATVMVSNPVLLCNKAEAMVAFNKSVRLMSESQGLAISDQLQEILAARWKALTIAITAFSAASKIHGADNLVNIHMNRGDVELLRYQLGQSQSPSGSGNGSAGTDLYAPAAKNSATLLKNAGTCYRGAAALARTDMGSWEEELKVAVVKEAVVGELVGGDERLNMLLKEEGETTWSVVDDMREEGLVQGSWVDRLMSR